MNSHKPVEMKEYIKYLGVYIDADLSWKHRIENKYYPDKKKMRWCYSEVKTFCSSSSSIEYFSVPNFALSSQVTKVHTTNY